MTTDVLVRSVVALLQWCKRQRTPKGGVALKRQAERLLGEALKAIEAEGFVSEESTENLHHSMALLAEYLDLIRKL